MADVFTGFVALLDVLGFSSLVRGGDEGPRLSRYLDGIRAALGDSLGAELDYVIFSDTIVLTTRNASDESLQILLSRCSALLGQMLQQDIALRGAIACGSFVREATSRGVFVAGKAVVDAYTFETQQNWVGTMLAPSTLQMIPDLADRCGLDLPGFSISSENGQRLIENKIEWAAFVQPCRSIPFHSNSPFDSNNFHGFAITPTSGVADAAAVSESIQASLSALAWLKSIAPNPAAQSKYERASGWLFPIQQKWREIAQAKERLKDEKGSV